jgi:hypothetical protein
MDLSALALVSESIDTLMSSGIDAAATSLRIKAPIPRASPRR